MAHVQAGCPVHSILLEAHERRIEENYDKMSRGTPKTRILSEIRVELYLYTP